MSSWSLRPSHEFISDICTHNVINTTSSFGLCWFKFPFIKRGTVSKASLGFLELFLVSSLFLWKLLYIKYSGVFFDIMSETLSAFLIYQITKDTYNILLLPLIFVWSFNCSTSIGSQAFESIWGKHQVVERIISGSWTWPRSLPMTGGYGCWTSYRGIDKICPFLKALYVARLSWLTRLTDIRDSAFGVPDWGGSSIFQKWGSESVFNYSGITFLSLHGNLYAGVLKLVESSIQVEQSCFCPVCLALDQLYSLPVV